MSDTKLNSSDDHNDHDERLAEEYSCDFLEVLGCELIPFWSEEQSYKCRLQSTGCPPGRSGAGSGVYPGVRWEFNLNVNNISGYDFPLW